MHHTAWGPESTGHDCDAVVIVDVLSFSTCVDVALSRGAEVIPFPHQHERASDEAAARGAMLAGPRSKTEPSLSPVSLRSLPRNQRLVLPSPNGSTLSLAFPGRPVFCACLRNASAVAGALAGYRHVLVVHAGEHNPDGTPRLAEEDMLSAGAVLAGLSGSLSPEAEAIRSLYQSTTDLKSRLIACPSGQELIERGFPEDVELAAELNVSQTVPHLVDGVYINQTGSR